ncbi:MAG: anti-sigma factor [Anaerolineales bacterium]|nr:MAG: anti-sigma factor [Anaerolineales bacterium]
MAADRHILELLPAYALDCLGEEELVRVSVHVGECPECRAGLSAYQAVVDQLALAVPLAEPPASLKSRLMERTQPGRTRLPAQARSSGWEWLTGLMQRSAPAWGLVSLALIAVLILSNLWLWGQLSGPSSPPEPALASTISLTGTQAAPEASGLLIINTDPERGTLVVDALPPLDPDQQYQLWLIQDGRRTSGGVFSVNQEGSGWLRISAPQPLPSYSAFGITIEPAGGSPGPTGDKVLGSTL